MSPLLRPQPLYFTEVCDNRWAAHRHVGGRSFTWSDGQLIDNGTGSSVSRVGQELFSRESPPPAEPALKKRKVQPISKKFASGDVVDIIGGRNQGQQGTVTGSRNGYIYVSTSGVEAATRASELKILEAAEVVPQAPVKAKVRRKVKLTDKEPLQAGSKVKIIAGKHKGEVGQLQSSGHGFFAVKLKPSKELVQVRYNSFIHGEKLQMAEAAVAMLLFKNSAEACIDLDLAGIIWPYA